MRLRKYREALGNRTCMNCTKAGMHVTMQLASMVWQHYWYMEGYSYDVVVPMVVRATIYHSQSQSSSYFGGGGVDKR